MNWTAIELLILDVDGVLTDGRIVSCSNGDWARAFHVNDGCALKLWMSHGHTVAISSGRRGDDVSKRARELGIEIVRTGVADKLKVYNEVVTSAGCDDASTAYVGDDLPDLGPMSRCALPIAVTDAVAPVKRAAEYVTRRGGGRGAVAEVVELILRKRGQWSTAPYGGVQSEDAN